MTEPTALPPGARVIHVGPYKTGTTALQSACHAAREDLEAQGVRYVSRTRHDAPPARHVTDRLIPGMDPERTARQWRRVVRRLRSAGEGRSFYSSEFLCEATEEQVARVARDVGVDDTWIVVTLRPVARLLPSQYQQDVQRGLDESYDAWLTDRMRDEPRDPFWWRHRHDRLIERWASSLGHERIVVVVVDSRDHGFLARTFEGLLGLRPGTLTDREGLDNRSLTVPEIALMRAFNRHYHATDGDPLFLRQVTHEACQSLKVRPTPPGLDKLVTPDWAIDHANAVGEEIATYLATSGVRVIGDTDTLSSTPRSGHDRVPPEPEVIPIEAAERFVSSFASAAKSMSARAEKRGAAAAARAAEVTEQPRR